MSVPQLDPRAAHDRRDRAARALPALATGDRDPLFPTILPRRPMHPATTLEVARIGGLMTRAEYRAAWVAYPEHRSMLNAAAAAQHEGWAAA